MTSAPLPWARIIGFGLGVLRLSPDAFWRMTPREFTHAAAFVGGATEAIDRIGLADLMARFPD
jgi:uncharacterized phage protein (TIGR02216 family)